MNAQSAHFSHRTLTLHRLLFGPTVESLSLQRQFLALSLLSVVFGRFKGDANLGFLSKKAVMKMHKQMTVFTSDSEPQNNRKRKEALFLLTAAINFVLNFKFLTISTEFFKL